MQIENSLYSILNHYQIEPEYIEDFGKVKKIYAHNGAYALKELDVLNRRSHPLFYAIQTLYQKGYKQVVPIIPTVRKEYFISDHYKSYYLMPWMETNEEQIYDHYHDSLKELAHLHSVTSKNQEVESEHFHSIYDTYMKSWNIRQQEFERYIEVCESKVYMSPFELLYCTYFHQLMQIEGFSRKVMEDWYEKVKEKKSERQVLCHGKLTPSHVVYDRIGKSYLLNFEHSYVGPPVFDIIYYVRRVVYYKPHLRNKMFEWFSTYHSRFQLQDDELLLMMAYLTQGQSIYKKIAAYEQGLRSTELNQVRQLQKHLWLSQNLFYFADQYLKAKQEQER